MTWIGSASRRVARGGRDAIESLSHDVQSVLGGKEEDRSRSMDGVSAQTGSSRRDCDGQIEGEERLAALGLSAHDPDRALAP
jgi:hypothetical protein